jgi:hypothetical protein
MNGGRPSPSNQNNRLVGHNAHSDTLRVGALTGTVTKLLNRATLGYSSQLSTAQPRRRVNPFYTLRT